MALISARQYHRARWTLRVVTHFDTLPMTQSAQQRICLELTKPVRGTVREMLAAKLPIVHHVFVD